MPAALSIHPTCSCELDGLLAISPREHRAMVNALGKLEAARLGLGYPHASALRGTGRGLRELRPRRGDSPWRLVYAPDDPPRVLALAPEAQRDPRGFRRAVESARARDRDLRGDHAR